MFKYLLVLIVTFMFSQDAFAFRCCQHGGGDAPGFYVTKKKCEKAGYVVKDGLLASCASASSGGVGNGSKMACVILEHSSIVDLVTKYMSEHSGNNDKFMHCSTSCMLKKRCGGFSTFWAGHAKEIKDLFDKKKHNSYGSGDNNANRKGRDIAEQVTSDQGCLAKCDQVF